MSGVGLAKLARYARERGVADRIHARAVDLDGALLPAGAYDLVLAAYFLDRRLFLAMAAAVRVGATPCSTPPRSRRWAAQSPCASW